MEVWHRQCVTNRRVSTNFLDKLQCTSNINRLVICQQLVHSRLLACFLCRDALNGSSNTSTIRVLDKFNYRFNEDYDEDDIKVIQYTTALVSHRAALLVSICTSVLLNRMTEDDITIAVDGSVYKHHPRIKIWMLQLIKQLSPEKKVNNHMSSLSLVHFSVRHDLS